jgi:predicted RNase H-like HicB family nuclease
MREVTITVREDNSGWVASSSFGEATGAGSTLFEAIAALQDALITGVASAVSKKRAMSYIGEDGCEITVTPDGHEFYNASDWF